MNHTSVPSTDFNVEDSNPTQNASIAQGTLQQPGDAAQVVVEDGRLPALETRTLGGLAPGLVAAQTTQDSFSDGRGLSSQPCLGPDTTWWFVGGGSTAGRESELVLVNPESTPAELEVAISGPDGPVSAPRQRGIVVEVDRVAVLGAERLHRRGFGNAVRQAHTGAQHGHVAIIGEEVGIDHRRSGRIAAS